jgi:hypothetical protein
MSAATTTPTSPFFTALTLGHSMHELVVPNVVQL